VPSVCDLHAAATVPCNNEFTAGVDEKGVEDKDGKRFKDTRFCNWIKCPLVWYIGVSEDQKTINRRQHAEKERVFVEEKHLHWLLVFEEVPMELTLQWEVYSISFHQLSHFQAFF